MSHELGALLLTETINHSIKENNKPIFCLYLDARSAFDLTIREIMVRHLYLVGTDGQQLLYIDNRLKHRRTFMEWDRKILGPINDELGFEQGGVSSGDFYTLYNSEQLTSAHEANLGVNVGPVQVSSIGQADDVVLLSDDINLLSHLLTLTLDYCEKHHVTLAPEKTKLMVFSAPRHKDLVSYQQAISPISINGTPIKFVSTAEHVGVIRSISGNLPHIQGRVTAHIRKLFALLPAGLARNQNANPSVSLRIQAIHSQPVLFSGISSLCLSETEIGILTSHHKNCLQNLMKLHPNTPEPYILFMAGSLGAKANVHLKQLSLFGMITRLPNNITYKIAFTKLSSDPDSSSSWFVQVRKLCSQYGLPSPLSLLTSPHSKCSYNSLVKKHVLEYWEEFMRSEAASKTSLAYFNTTNMSLTTPHPLWTTSGSNPFEINKSIIVARLLSG